MKKIIPTLAVSAFLIPFITMIGLTDYYSWNRPESAQPELARTVPIKITHGREIAHERVHDQIVYVTSTEANCLHVMYALTAVGAGIFACYIIVGVVKAKRGSDGS
jgi:hypothetical protein